MAITNILTTGSTATSVEEAVAATTRYGIKAASGAIPAGGVIYVDIKDDQGAYTQMAILGTRRVYIDLLPGTYRFRRKANGRSVGVFKAA